MSHNYVMFLKENWGKWYFVDDTEKMEQIITKGVNEEASSMAQKQQEYKMKNAL